MKENTEQTAFEYGGYDRPTTIVEMVSIKMRMLINIYLTKKHYSRLTLTTPILRDFLFFAAMETAQFRASSNQANLALLNILNIFL